MNENAMTKRIPSALAPARLDRARAITLQTFGAALALTATAGCEGGPGSGRPADFVNASAFEVSAQATAPIDSALLYYSVRPDPRLCPSPLCGGFWVKAVNRSTTVCADGTSADSCYIASIDWRAMGGDPQISAATVLVRGTLRLQAYPSIGGLGLLVAHDAWGSATDASPAGGYFRLSDRGIICVTTPCFNVGAEALNLGISGLLSGYDLSKVGAAEEQLKLAEMAFRQGRLLASGFIYPVNSTTRTGGELVASQFFLPARWWCHSDAECGAMEKCNAAEICLPPPGCSEGGVCATVCGGYCVR